MNILKCLKYTSLWGIGLKQDDPRAGYKEQWKGANSLGKSLMDVRKWALGREGY